MCKALPPVLPGLFQTALYQRSVSRPGFSARAQARVTEAQKPKLEREYKKICFALA
jgi:hypothetical protein